jgi:hypothetical protein
MKVLALSVILIGLVGCGKKTETKYSEKIVTVEKPAAPRLSCKVYDLGGAVPASMPDFSALASIGSVDVESLNNTVTNNVTPFQMLLATPHERFSGTFWVSMRGETKNRSNWFTYFLLEFRRWNETFC